jgi:hypothetical protein
MPIEIKELHIKTVVENGPTAQNQQQNSGNNQAAGDPDKIVALCVEQVMEILKNKNER